jgi:hypothetical protein
MRELQILEWLFPKHGVCSSYRRIFSLIVRRLLAHLAIELAVSNLGEKLWKLRMWTELILYLMSMIQCCIHIYTSIRSSFESIDRKAKQQIKCSNSSIFIRKPQQANRVAKQNFIYITKYHQSIISTRKGFEHEVHAIHWLVPLLDKRRDQLLYFT